MVVRKCAHERGFNIKVCKLRAQCRRFAGLISNCTLQRSLRPQVGDLGTHWFIVCQSDGRKEGILKAFALCGTRVKFGELLQHSGPGFCNRAGVRAAGRQGALLNVKLPHLAAWTARRQAIAARYLAEITLADVRLPEQPAYGKSVFHQFTIRHPRRDALREHLAKHDVGTDLIYPVPLHLQKCYAYLGRGVGSFPVAEKAAATCVSLPIFPELTDDQVGQVIAGVNSF